MINRNALVITALAAVVATGYNISQIQKTTSIASRPAGAPPIVASAPSIKLQTPQTSGIGSLDVWNLKPLTLSGQLPLLKDMFKPFYTLSKAGRFESVQRSDRPNDRWEFQGVVTKGDKLRALFYNPALKKLKNLGRGDVVDERLAIRNIGAGSVTLEVVGEKKPQKFELRIFNSNKDSYVAKRKTT